jgi:hypothetical protein
MLGLMKSGCNGSAGELVLLFITPGRYVGVLILTSVVTFLPPQEDSTQGGGFGAIPDPTGNMHTCTGEKKQLPGMKKVAFLPKREGGRGAKTTPSSRLPTPWPRFPFQRDSHLDLWRLMSTIRCEDGLEKVTNIEWASF